MNVVDTSSIRGITYISDDHGNDVDSDTEELINNSRLQKLLTMMDRVSNAVHAMMSSVIHSHTIKREQTSSISPSENIDINTNQCSAKLYPEITNVCSGKPKLLTGGVLRDYQLGGVEWILSLFANGLNGILAGTGITSNAISCAVV